jgi:hypothetical protein
MDMSPTKFVIITLVVLIGRLAIHRRYWRLRK